MLHEQKKKEPSMIFDEVVSNKEYRAKNMNTIPLYLKTNDMAQLIGYSGDYLLNNRDVIFFEGIHYFPKSKRIDWKVSIMIDWVENQTISSQAKEILDLVI